MGREIGASLAGKGVRVLSAARTTAACDVTLDVTRKDQIASLADSLRDGLDILVNNAAVSLDGFSADVARATVDVNFFGAMSTTDCLLPRMRPGARIVMASTGIAALSLPPPTLPDPSAT